MPTHNIAALGGAGSIQYYIPLGDNSGVYGAAGSCGATGFGTCSDYGNGGGTLTMILRFDPVSTTSPSTLTVKFLDLDLDGANDPSGFLESMRVYNGMTAITPWITSIGGMVTGNADYQTLTLGLGTLTQSPLFLQLKFKANSHDYGINTPEDLRATIYAVPGPIVGAGLPGALMLVGGLIGLWRRRPKAG